MESYGDVVLGMMVLIKRGEIWLANANGHVLQERFMREFKRKGADIATLSQEQWEGYFGEAILDEPKIDGIKVAVDASMPEDEVRFFKADELMGRIQNLYVTPSKPEESA